MKYYYSHSKPSMNGAKLLTVKREQLNALRGLTFVSIAFYEMPNGEKIGIVF